MLNWCNLLICYNLYYIKHFESFIFVRKIQKIFFCLRKVSRKQKIIISPNPSLFTTCLNSRNIIHFSEKSVIYTLLKYTSYRDENLAKHHLLSSLGSLSKVHETTNSQTIKSRFSLASCYQSNRFSATAWLKLSATLGQVNAEKDQNSMTNKKSQTKTSTKIHFIDCAIVRSTVKQSAKYDDTKALNLADSQRETNELGVKETDGDLVLLGRFTCCALIYCG